jgi:threonylcarbamoyladenosine tRNA methylthiotransferase MtaB
VAASQKFLPHFHIPLQSGSDNILKLMKRRYNRELFSEKILMIKRAIPNVFIGVDIIVGFPGETHEDFEQSYQLLADLKPSFLHVFPYSERPNTPAADYTKKVKSKDITQRASSLQSLSNTLHADFYNQNIGRSDEALFESAQKNGLMHGFTRNYVKVEYPYQKDLIGKISKVTLAEISASGNFKVQIAK